MKHSLLFAFSRRALARSAALFAMGLHALLFPSRLCGEATLLLAAYLFFFGSLALRDGLLLRGPARMERLLCGVLGVALSAAALLWQRFEPETLPLLHGAFCLYNGGFTAAFTCFMLIPVLEHFFHTKEERKSLKA